MNHLWNFFIDHFRFSYVIIASIVLLGTFSIMMMPKESDPQVIVPVGVVNTHYPGASALDVEELITNEIEKEIENLDDVKSYTSTSTEGFSSIVVEFNADAEIRDRIQALKDAVDSAMPDLPQDAETPNVQQVSFSDQPIMIFSLSAPVTEVDLKDMAETFQNAVEKISGIQEAKITGARDREIQIIVDQSKLEHYEVSLSEIVRAIQQNDAQFPLGSIEQNNTQYTLRFEGGLKDTGIIPFIPVTTRGGFPVLVQDLATMTDGLKDITTISRLSVEGRPAQSSVGIEIFKQDGADILRVLDQVESTVAELQKGALSTAEVFVSFNQAKEIRKSLNNLLWNGTQTVIIVFLLLFFFLGLSEAGLAGMSIPFTFLIALTALSALGFTLNFLTLFSLILSLGILVDAAIVMVEGMHEQINRGKSAIQAAKDTIHEFQWPIISGVMTTVSAFFPMIFASGVTGQFIRTIPVTVSIVLISSLFVALGVTPVLGSRFLKGLFKHDKPSEKKKRVVFIDHMATWYRVRLEHFLGNKKEKRIFSVLMVGAFVFAMSLPFLGAVKIELFPTPDLDQFSIQIEAPIGTVVEQTDQYTRELENLLYQDIRILSFVSTVGSAGGQSTSSSGSSGHLARFTVNLVEAGDREPSELIVEEYREKMKSYPQVRVTVSQQDAGPPQGAPVEITFSGPDLNKLESLMKEGEALLESIEGTADIDRSIKDSPFEYAFHINRQKAIQVGVTPIEIAQFIRTAVFGVNATTLKIESNDVEVLVKMNLNHSSSDTHESTMTSVDHIQLLAMQTPRGTIPLASLLDTSLQRSQNSIQHEEGDRISKVTSQTTPGANPGDIVSAFEQREDELDIPEEYQVSFGGEREEVQQSFGDMYRAMIIGVFLIASILVLQFNSFRQPFFIMVSLPFAMIGVFPGLAITGQSLSFPAFIGIVALVGIVVNDAIILIDQMNNNLRAGMLRHKAVVEAAVSRLQPVILTTVTTVFGILPLTLSEPIWGPLGFTIIFGLTFATVLTLIFVPMLYERFAEGVNTEKTLPQGTDI